MRGAFDIDGPSGERWELALDLLATGGRFVSFGSLFLYRDTSGPEADGKVHVVIVSAWSASHARNESRSVAEIAEGLHRLDLLVSDPRMAAIVTEHGVVREYVADYGTGQTLLATVAQDGTPTWA